MKKSRKHEDITETPDVSYIHNPDVAHEASDVNVRAILWFVGGLVIFAALVHVLMWGMFKFLEEREVRLEQQNPPSPMAVTNLPDNERLPPEPRLQAARGYGVSADKSDKANLESEGFKVDENGRVNLELEEPQAEMKIVGQMWDQELNKGKVDPNTGAIISIPIAEAKKQLIEKGLPARSQAGGENPLVTGLDFPSYPSSGRMTEKREQ